MEKKFQKPIYAAVFLALGMVLPLLTLQIKEIGDSLLPMHLCIMLCGLFCGWKYGLACGLLLPFLRSLIFGMPPIYPNAVWMATELATYGLCISVLFDKIFKRRFKLIFPALIITMLLGRIVWGITKVTLLGLSGKSFTLAMFFVGGFADAVPGIILQLVLIPLILKIAEKKVAR